MFKSRWHVWLWVGFILIVVVGCGGSGGDTVAPTPETEVVNATPTVNPLPTDTPAPTSTSLPPVTPTPHPTNRATALPTATDIPPTATRDLTAALTDVAMAERVLSIKDVGSITTYRYRFVLTINDQTPTSRTNLPLGGNILESTVAKEPPRQEVLIKSADVADQVLREVDGKVYSYRTGEWVHDPTLRTRLDPEKMILLSAAQIEPFLGEMTLIGEASMNERTTLHYQAGHETLGAISAQNGQPGYTEQLEDSSADIWVDAEERFIIRIERIFIGKGFQRNAPDEVATLKMVVDFYDFNADITVEGLDTPPPIP